MEANNAQLCGVSGETAGRWFLAAAVGICTGATHQGRAANLRIPRTCTLIISVQRAVHSRVTFRPLTPGTTALLLGKLIETLLDAKIERLERQIEYDEASPPPRTPSFHRAFRPMISGARLVGQLQSDDCHCLGSNGRLCRGRWGGG